MDLENGTLTNAFNERYDILTRKILRLLSVNSRISVLEISKELGISRRTIKERMVRMENELGIRYTIELNEKILGISQPHLITVKFFSKPDFDEIKKVLAKSYIPQLAVITKGKYDMLIFANAASSQEYVHWEMTTKIALSKYSMLWQSSEVAHRQLGFFPVRDVFLDKLDIPDKHKKMLKLLNLNSRISFKEISETLGMHFNTVAYNFNKLVELKYIKSFTLVMKQPEKVTLTGMFAKYVLADNFENDAVKMRREVGTVDDPYSILNRFFINAQLIGSYDVFIAGAFDNPEASQARFVHLYKRHYKRHRIKVVDADFVKVLVGDLPLRTVDIKSTFATIKWIASE